MTIIYKYPLQMIDQQIIQMPPGAQLLSVQIQNDVPCLWALVDPNYGTVPVTIHTCGTGNPIDAGQITFIDTYQLHNGGLIFHVFKEE